MDLYEFKSVAYAIAGKDILNVDSCKIQAGSITALTGPNGSGKSTLLDLMAFIRAPAKGEIYFKGQSTQRVDYLSLRRQVAYVQQKPYLFNKSVRENIEIGLQIRNIDRDQRRRRTDEIIELCEIELLSGRRAHELSGGEMQKVAIARALVLDQQVLILDEPFSHLDDSFTQFMEKMLQRVKEESTRTVIISTHDQIQAQKFSDKLISLSGGKIVPVSTINLFKGRVDDRGSVFDTGRIKIDIPDMAETGDQVSIEATQIVISMEKLVSSMRNNFRGKVKSLKEEGKQVYVTVDAGETFQVIITKATLREMQINLGDSVWLSFKSSAVHVF